MQASFTLPVQDGHSFIINLLLLPAPQRGMARDALYSRDDLTVEMSVGQNHSLDLPASNDRTVVVNCQLSGLEAKRPKNVRYVPRKSLEDVFYGFVKGEPGIVVWLEGDKKFCKLTFAVHESMMSLPSVSSFSSRLDSESNLKVIPEKLDSFTFLRYSTSPNENGSKLVVKPYFLAYNGTRHRKDMRKSSNSWPFGRRWLAERVNNDGTLKRKHPIDTRKRGMRTRWHQNDDEKARKTQHEQKDARLKEEYLHPIQPPSIPSRSESSYPTSNASSSTVSTAFARTWHDNHENRKAPSGLLPVPRPALAPGHVRASPHGKNSSEDIMIGKSRKI